MSIEGKRSISDLDRGLRTLKKFIEDSEIGKQSENRKLTTDAPHQFEITTTLPQRRDQRQPDTEVYVVKIPEGSILYFLQRTAATTSSPSAVDDSDFIVNDGLIGWHINTFRRTVRRLRYNFGGKVVHLKPKANVEE